MALDPGSGVPRHRQLSDALRQQIRSGVLPPGARLPSERDLMQAWGLGRFAVRQALTTLRGEGLLAVSVGRGTRVRGHTDVMEIEAGPGTVIECRMPSPDERALWGIPEGVPVLLVIGPDGLAEPYAGDRVRVVVPAGDPPPSSV